MRSLLVLLASACALYNTHAIDLYDQLVAFNPNWSDHRSYVEGRPARPLVNDVDYVRMHLNEVLVVLRDAGTTELSIAQVRMRNELINVLAAYAREGRFPLNHHCMERTPVFIDEHETYCAVGHLMRSMGCDALARRIAATDNYAWVKDISDPELPAWQVMSGFSLAELKLIQGAYDNYLPFAYLLPDKYEVPQKPEQVVRYFEGAAKERIWCFGEGTNGDLHGRWVQNYSSTLPWIEGYFEHGKRSGRWKEYYKGTNTLCRTEHWRNDKLNGVRTRYDREGNVIETIQFENGVAVIKTNIDREKALRWVRRPIDSAMVRTEVFTEEGALIAAGNERIHNPEGLLWFQNIELTALNSFAISARDGAPLPELVGYSNNFDRSQQQLPGSHTLVTYLKEGPWVYYKDYLNTTDTATGTKDRLAYLALGYKHFGPEVFGSIARYDHLERTTGYDSLRVEYAGDRMIDLFGYASVERDHLHFTYHPWITIDHRRMGRWSQGTQSLPGHIKRIDRLDENGSLIGVSVDFDRQGRAVREEHYLVPFKPEEEVGVVEGGIRR